VRAFARELAERPMGCASLLIALEQCLDPPTTVLLRGDATTCAAWQLMLERAFRPTARVLDLSRQGTLPGALAKPEERGDEAATAWVCKGASCLPPVHSLDALEAALAS
jgi:uncharacterized protein YyaL (SSP411 family)